MRVLGAGGLALLKVLIGVMRALQPAQDEPFPPWQGMQYNRDMFSGAAASTRLDNARYPGIAWTTAREYLASPRRSFTRQARVSYRTSPRSATWATRIP